MQKRWRHMAGILAAAIMLGGLPVYAETEKAETEKTETETADTADENVAEPAEGSYIISQAIPEIFWPETDVIYEDVTEAAEALRAQLMMRGGTVRVNYDGQDGKDLAEQFFLQALAYDEDIPGPGGDYLKYHYTDAKTSTYEVTEGDRVYYQYEYQVTYLSSIEQEMAVEDAVADMMKGLDTSDDINKISDIYNELVTDSVPDETGDSSYNVKSAYAALVEKKASSEGYAAALYRLLKEADIDSRIVVGKVGDETQAWNMVELDGVWYYLDPFEDLGQTEWTAFLKGAAFAQKHVQTNQDDTFASYTVSPQDYTGEIPESSVEDNKKNDDKDETAKGTKAAVNDTQLWINQCYVYLLGREANAKELADQEKWFTDNEKDVQALLLNLTHSDEYKNKHDIKETGAVLDKLFADPVFAAKAPVDFDIQYTSFAYRMYNYFLKRQPDLQGLKYYVKELTDQRKTLEDVCLSLIESDEGKKVEMEDEAYINALYVVLLNRVADEAGMANWKADLKKSDRKTVLHAFANSDECKKKYPNTKFAN